MANLTDQMVSEIDISAILNTYVYFEIQNEKYNKKSLKYIMKDIKRQIVSEEQNAIYEKIMTAIDQNPALGNLVLIDQSMTDNKHDENLIIACTFKDPATNTIYVSYRGTGDGKWVDNGEGMTAESTVMQREAEKYFDRVMENVLSEEERTDYRIIVTGHSKGGNEAQFVTMHAKYRELIDNCYNIDGQGFSREAIEMFKEELGEEVYEEYKKKMFSICGENDYVHDLGNVIIPEENTYFIPTPEADGLGPWHDIKYMIDGSGFNWERNENGIIVQGEQGKVGIIVKGISRGLMKQSDAEINGVAMLIMSGIEYLMPYDDELGGKYKYGTGNREFVTFEDIFFMVSSFWVSIDLEKYIPGGIGDYIGYLKDMLEPLLADAFNWYSERYNSYIKIDTYMLCEYARRLKSVNNRVSSLDSRMDSLYYRVGLRGILNLLHADILIGESWKLNKCMEYLNSTAEDFENVERAIVEVL